MAYSSTNYIYDRILTKFKSFLRTEAAGSLPVYIGEEYKKQRSSHIRIFVNSITDVSSQYKQILNEVDISVNLYLNTKRKDVVAQNALTDLTNRIEQVLFENRRDENNYFDGKVEDIEFNIKEDEEVFVDNLLVSRINYSVKIPLTYQVFGYFLDANGNSLLTSVGENLVLIIS